MFSSIDRSIVAGALGGVIDDVVSEHYNAKTQEHHLTSRIAATLDMQPHTQVVVGGRKIIITTQEFPDKGRGSLEKPTGIDLYVTITDDSLEGFDKGFFVQSKWKKIKRTKTEQGELVKQCEKMLSIWNSSYVWLYGPDGVEIVRAKEVVDQPWEQPERLNTRSANDVFNKVLKCYEGDFEIGIKERNNRRAAINSKMEEFRIKASLDLLFTDMS